MISEYAEQESRSLESMKSHIQGCIDALPDNCNIDRVSQNAFTVSSSELGKHDNWSPEFHDFKAQYQVVLSRLQSVKSIAEFQRFLKGAVMEKQITKGKVRYRLHPDVLVQLQALL
jgi:hypothetical protein